MKNNKIKNKIVANKVTAKAGNSVRISNMNVTTLTTQLLSNINKLIFSKINSLLLYIWLTIKYSPIKLLNFIKILISLFSLFTIIFGSGIILSLTYYDMQDIFTILFTFKDNVLIYIIKFLNKFITRDVMLDEIIPQDSNGSINQSNLPHPAKEGEDIKEYKEGPSTMRSLYLCRKDRGKG